MTVFNRPIRSLSLTAACLLVIGTWAPAASAQYGYHFGRNKVQYDDFDWRMLQTEHFDIYYYPEMLELAEQGAWFAEEAYRDMQNRFVFSLTKRVPLIFYSSNLHFKQTNTTPGFIPDGVGGFFEFLKGRVVIPANGNIQRFRRVIRHELVHVFTYNRLIRVMRDHRRSVDRFLPLWFTEGLAEYWSGPQDNQHEMVVRDALFANLLVPLRNIDRIYGTFSMYKQGEAICRFIADEWGEEKLLDLIDGFWKDRDFRKVIEATLFLPYDDFAREWEEWMRSRYYPDLEFTEMPSLIADAVSSGGFSAKPAVYLREDGTRQVFFVGNRTGWSNLYSVDVDSLYRPQGKPRIVLEGGRSDRFEAFHLFESRLSISADGHLAFVTKSGGSDVVHVYNVRKGRIDSTLAFEELVAVYSPSWSPDGRSMAFTAIDRTGYSDLYVFDLDTAELERLTDDDYDDRDPAWSPDGSRLAFVSDRTDMGWEGSYNLFLYHLDSGRIEHVTHGERMDAAPAWSPDGRQLAFTSAIPDSSGQYSAQDIWVADIARSPGLFPATASLHVPEAAPVRTSRTLRRVTRLAGASFDPVWTRDDYLVFTSFEGLSFGIRALAKVDSLVVNPIEKDEVDLTGTGEPWSWPSLAEGKGYEPAPYRKRFRLDLAQGLVSQSPVLGTVGGAVLAFSDMMGDDYLYLTIFNTANTQRELLKSLSFQVARYQLHSRANIGYGVYRFGGLRYDVTDPDAPSGFPRFYETTYGGFGVVSYPVSQFRRIEVGTSLNWNNKEIAIRNIDRDALLLSNGISFVQDNALYWYNGPIDGWRARLDVAYTTDIRYSNVSYFSVVADIRKYWRLARNVTFASWAMARVNDGREARLWVLGGSWDLRGFHFFDVRGQKMWFTSHELRFPILVQPTVTLPVLAPFGVANLRGALFFDAAHAWNDEYNERHPEIVAGETVGSAGFGFRLNLFGGFVLRYDLGWRFRDGFKRHDKWFKQFFFGWDF